MNIDVKLESELISYILGNLASKNSPDLIDCRKYFFKIKETYSLFDKLVNIENMYKFLLNQYSEWNSVDFFSHVDDKVSFIRGYFDCIGVIEKISINKPYPVCSLSIKNNILLKSITDYINIPFTISKNELKYSHNNALDFMDIIYKDARFSEEYKHDLYLKWAQWSPFKTYPVGYRLNPDYFTVEYAKTRIDAVTPSKTRASDSGFDLTLLEKIEQKGVVEIYETGIQVKPPYGFYFDLVPRSSIIKSGYILANSIGIIDRTYTGTIKVPLIKVNPNASDLILPNKLVQIIPRQIIHTQFKLTDELDKTTRGDGGFGSTDKGKIK